MKETITKINKTKSSFFEKIDKISKPLVSLIRKKREKTQFNRIRNEKGEVIGKFSDLVMRKTVRNVR